MKNELCLEFVVLVLAAGLWLVAAPLSLGRDFSPAELIEKDLPHGVTMKSASNEDFLSAVCTTVRKNRKSTAAITSAAVAARGDFSGEIVGTVLRCVRKPDCASVRTVVGAAVTANPAAGTAISDAAMARAPNCSESIQAAVNAAAKREAEKTAAIPAVPAAVNGPRPAADEGFDPHEPLVLICADGVERAIRESLVEEFMHAHPASFLGTCPPTVPSRPPAPSPPASPSPTPGPKN